MTTIDAIPNVAGATNPSPQGSQETLPYTFDFTPLLLGGESVATVTATLVNTYTGVAYPAGLSGSPTVIGNVAKQIITALVPTITYLLTIKATLNSGTVWEMTLTIPCPV